jgi:predicted transcriptional regulator
MYQALDSSLNCSEKMVLICLSNCSNEDGFCTIKRETMIKQCGLSRTTLHRTVQKLTENGFVKATKQWDKNIKSRSLFYQISLKKLASNLSSDVKIEQKYVCQSETHNDDYVCQSETHNDDYVCQSETHKEGYTILDINNNYINNKNIREIVKRDEKSKSKSESVTNCHQVNEIFEFWKNELNHAKAVLDAKRKKLIANALSTHDAQFLKNAISGNKLSKWHQGGNSDGKVYNSIELILRNNEKIEYFQQIFEVESKKIASQQKREAELYKKPEVPVITDEDRKRMAGYASAALNFLKPKNLQIST